MAARPVRSAVWDRTRANSNAVTSTMEPPCARSRASCHENGTGIVGGVNPARRTSAPATQAVTNAMSEVAVSVVHARPSPPVPGYRVPHSATAPVSSPTATMVACQARWGDPIALMPSTGAPRPYASGVAMPTSADTTRHARPMVASLGPHALAAGGTWSVMVGVPVISSMRRHANVATSRVTSQK